MLLSVFFAPRVAASFITVIAVLSGLDQCQSHIVVPHPIAEIDSRSSEFGASVAADGKLVAVGAPRQYTDGARGAVFVFRDDGIALDLEAQLVDPHPQSGARYGEYLVLDGVTLAVEALGRVDVYRRTGGSSGSSWVLEEEIVLPSPHIAESIAVDGNVMVVGATPEDGEGAVFVYQRVPREGRWQLAHQLEYPWNAQECRWDNQQGVCHFGYAVAVAGDRVLVSAPEADNGKGAVFVYERVSASFGDIWEYRSFLESGPPFSRERGRSIAVSGSRVAVTPLSNPEINFYELPSALEQDAAIPSDHQIFYEESSPFINIRYDRFDQHLKMDGDMIVVAGPTFDKAHAFQFSNGTWSEFATFTSDPTDASSRGFGDSVAVVGSTFYVGNPTEEITDNGEPPRTFEAGAVHLHRYGN